METGLIHLYIGDGKGKTSAALGLLLRASGAGLRVTLAQFLKDGQSAERAALKHLSGVQALPCPGPMKFLWEMTDEEKAACARDTRVLFSAAVSAPCDVLILDEVLDAVNAGMLPESTLLSFLDQKDMGLEVVLTGRDPSPALLSRAHYVTDMKSLRHPYDSGTAARRGIEY